LGIKNVIHAEEDVFARIYMNMIDAAATDAEDHMIMDMITTMTIGIKEYEK
jgi:hypothetical protein